MGVYSGIGFKVRFSEFVRVHPVLRGTVSGQGKHAFHNK